MFILLLIVSGRLMLPHLVRELVLLPRSPAGYQDSKQDSSSAWHQANKTRCKTHCKSLFSTTCYEVLEVHLLSLFNLTGCSYSEQDLFVFLRHRSLKCYIGNESISTDAFIILSFSMYLKNRAHYYRLSCK